MMIPLTVRDAQLPQHAGQISLPGGAIDPGESNDAAALREASDALAGVRLGRDQLVAQQTQARALTIAASIAERRYASGVSSYLEVLNAEQSLFNAQLNLVAVEQQYLTATVQLYKALGGSWDGVAK